MTGFLAVAHQQGHKVNIIADSPYTPGGVIPRAAIVHRRKRPYMSFGSFFRLVPAWRPLWA